MIASRRQLKAHAGPWFTHWRRQSAKAIGAVLAEELELEE